MKSPVATKDKGEVTPPRPGRRKRSNGDLYLPAEVAADPGDVIELRDQGESLRGLDGAHAGRAGGDETTFFGGLTHAEAARG